MTWFTTSIYVNTAFFLVLLGYSIFAPGIALAIGCWLGSGQPDQVEA